MKILLMLLLLCSCATSKQNYCKMKDIKKYGKRYDIGKNVYYEHNGHCHLVRIKK
jgi:hypothetical protein